MSLKKYRSYLINVAISLIALSSSSVSANDLQNIKERGVLRHIGVPYANFISYIQHDESKVLTGLDVEIIQGFAKSLGVEYEYVPAQWNNAMGKLTGQTVQYKNEKVIYGETVAIEGDLVANGVTVFDWRKEVINYSLDYFPSAVWLVARNDSDLKPIIPSGSLEKDIENVKLLINGRDVLAMKHTCLDPDLYNLNETGAKIIIPNGQRHLNEMVPAIMKNDAETTLLDVADTLIALEKWPGEIKVIGPISGKQKMAVAFRHNSPELLQAFNSYLNTIRQNGTYHKMVEKYYPSIYYFYNDYFLKNSKNIL